MNDKNVFISGEQNVDLNEMENSLSVRVFEINLLNKINSITQDIKSLVSNKQFTGHCNKQWSKLVRERLGGEIDKLNRAFANLCPLEYTSHNKRRKLESESEIANSRSDELSQQICKQKAQIDKLETQVKVLRSELIAKDKQCKVKEKENISKQTLLQNQISKLNQDVKVCSEYYKIEVKKLREFRQQTGKRMKLLEEEKRSLTQQAEKHCQEIYNMNAVIGRYEKEIEQLQTKLEIQSEKFKLERESFQVSNTNIHYPEGAKTAKKLNLLKQAKLELKTNNFSKAVEMLTCAMDLDSVNALSDASLLYQRGIAYVCLGKFSESLKDSVSLLTSVSISCYLLQAYCKMQETEIDDAIKYFNRLSDLQCKDAVYYLYRGKMLKELGNRIHEYEEHYKVLGIEKDAGEEEIKKAYKDLALCHHPDKHSTSNEEIQHQQAELFKSIKEASNTLLDPQSKVAYHTNTQEFQSYRSELLNVLFDKCHLRL